MNNENDFIDSYRVAFSIVDEAVQSHDKAWKLIKEHQEHIDGKPPMSQNDLKKNGMAWASNWNYGKARAKLEKVVAENISKVSNAISLSYVTFKEYEDNDLAFLENREEAAIHATTIASCLVMTLLRESRMSDWLNSIEYPATAFGYCAVVDKEDDWLPEAIHPKSVAFRPNSKPEDIECWVTFGIITANELWRKWANWNKTLEQVESQPEQLTAEMVSIDGWNMQGIQNVLFKAFKRTGEYRSVESWEDISSHYNNNCSAAIQNTHDIHIAKIFYKESNGTITECRIPWANEKFRLETKVSSNTNETAGEYILYKKKGRSKNQDDYITLIRDSGFSVSGYIQDLRGLAKYAVPDSIRYNRIRNNINNKGILTGSPMFEKANSSVGDGFKVTVSQGFVILPTTHNLVDKQPSYNIGEQINILRFEENEFQRETQQFDATITGRLTSRPNRGEVEQVTQEVQTLNASKNNIKLRDYSVVLRRILHNIVNKKLLPSDAGYEGQKRFFSYVKKGMKGVVETDDDVKKVVKAIDSFIIDPIIHDENTIMLAIQMAETPFARNRFRRMLLVSRGMPIEEVNIAVPMIQDKFTMLQDDRVAAFENDMFWTTNEVVFTGTDDHVIHLESHILKGQNVIKGVMEGRLSPIDGYKWLANAVPHSSLHLDILGSDPALNEKAREYSSMLQEIASETRKIEQMAGQMIQAQQEAANQPEPLKPEVEAEIANKNAKTIADTQRKDWIAAQRTQQREKQIELSHEQKLREIELKNSV
jgi:hypothetical protein